MSNDPKSLNWKNLTTGKADLWDLGLTLIHPFFGEEKRFEIQYDNWMKLPTEVKDAIKIIVVDDCGKPAMHELMTPSKVKRCDLNLSIFRITDDIRYNTAGALNLGIMMADTAWTLIMDSDCLFEGPEFQKLMTICPDKNWVYKFDRNRITENAHWKKNTRYLPCTMLQHKDIFLDINGFDEDFCYKTRGGYAFFDNHYDYKFQQKYKWAIIKDIIATEYMDDYVGERIQRSKAEEQINKKLMYEKIEGRASLSTDMLRFSWERMFHNVR